MSQFLSRRELFQAGAAAAAAVALGLPESRADREPEKKRNIKKAIMYGTLSYPGSVLEKFQAARDAGYEGVEPNSHMNQDEVVAAFAATGLKPASVCCNTHWGKPLSQPDPKLRQEGLEGLLQALKDAKRYGASSVLLVPGVVNKDASYQDCFNRSVTEIRKAIPVAKELGVKIAIENVWNDFITKPEQAKEYLDAIDSPHVGWHFDIGNTVRFNDPETWIPILGKRILKLHIKEYSRVKGFGVRFFEGDNHWPAIMKALDEVGYTGWGISEQPGDQAKTAERLKDLTARMDKIFAS